ncbi:MAG: hypothetical protein RMK99_03200 [Anaerolineales bacterium]|nr:hypothetical protein [Anaerolineales bacterium]
MMQRFGPAIIVMLVMAAQVAVFLARNNGDAGEMMRLGIRRMAGDQSALEGYDGQYVYVLALNPNPVDAARAPTWVLDVPAYRYQRILLSLLVGALSLGNAAAVPWLLLGLNIVIQAAGTFLVGELLATYSVSRWYALVYGLWVGFAYAVRLAMTEPLAYALVAGALLVSRHGREGWAALLYGLALFTKEVTVLFAAAHLVWLLSQRRWPDALRLFGVAFVPFALFQLMIWAVFGRPGLGSGGFHGSGFEWIPYNGLWRIGAAGWRALLLFSVIYFPIAVLPSLWGMVTAAARVLQRDRALPVWVLGANAAIFPFTPFSTYSEPLGLVRLVCGLVLAVLVFGAYSGSKRVLNYAVFSTAALVMLLNEVR